MKAVYATLVFLILMPLAGCTLGTFGTGSQTAAPDLTGNWQLSSVNVTPSASSNVLLTGALASSGANVTGTFRFSNLTPGNGCGALNQVITVSGKVNTANPLAETLSLTSAVFSGSTLTAQFSIPAAGIIGSSGTLSGTIQVTGSACTFASSPGVAIEFPPITGTFTGGVSAAPTINGASSNGTATLKAVQSTTPNADGQFAVTGSLAFVSGTCSSSFAVAGTVSGSTILMTSPITPGTTGVVTFAGVDVPLTPTVATQQLQGASLIYYPAPCSASLSTVGTYNGTLLKQ